MQNRFIFALFLGIGTLVFISFKSVPSFQEPWKAPAEADTIKSPFPFTPQVVREGEKLFNALCVSCHGSTGLGDGQPGRFKIDPANFHSKQVTEQMVLYSGSFLREEGICRVMLQLFLRKRDGN